MKKRIPLTIGIILLAFVSSMTAQTSDTIKGKNKKDETKTGFNFGALPVVSYDSDLGLQLGALVNFYHYGDGNRYPKYDHSLYLEGSWYLKGSGIFRMYYDSEKLIKGVRTSLDVSYLPDQAYKFYGFNGYDAIYNKDWEDTDSDTYKTRMFYRLDRKFFRAKLDFQGKIWGDNLKWLAGADFYDIRMDEVNIDKLNKGKDSDLLPSHDSIPGLFQTYKRWGILPANDTAGGNFTVFKLGVVFDSRDNEPNPMRGIWTEIILATAPKVTSSMDEGFAKLAITHRQYFTLKKDVLSFAYRLGGQFNLLGHTPFYAQGLMYYSKMAGAYNEGLGGAKTLRGIQRNRIVGDGFVFGNLELRWKFVHFRWINQNFYLALSGFFDTGRSIQYIDINDEVENIIDANYVKSEYFDPGTEKFHSSVGAGLHIAMNQNFIIAIDWGKALNEQDGSTGLYIGMNFLF